MRVVGVRLWMAGSESGEKTLCEGNGNGDGGSVMTMVCMYPRLMCIRYIR